MIRALRHLLNPQSSRATPIRFGRASFEFDRNRLTIGDRENHLELKQSLVLLRLLAGSPQVVSKADLLAFGWPDTATGDDVLAVAISHIRKALGDSPRTPQYIKTVSGRGYQLVASLSSRDRERAGRLVRGEPASTQPSGRMLRFGLLFAAVSAAVIASALLRLSPDPLEQARELLASPSPADWPAALAEFEQSYAASPDSKAALLGIFDAQWRILNSEPRLLHAARGELRAWLERAQALDPTDVRIHARLARLSFLVDWDLSAAYLQYRKAIAISPNEPELHLGLAQLQLALGEFDNASASLERSRALNPRHFATETAAWIYNMQRNYAQAKIELERLLAVRPDTLAYHVSAQSVFENSGDNARAFEHLERALQLIGYDTDQLATAAALFADGGLASVYRWLLIDQRETRNIGQYQPPLAHARYAIRAGELNAAFQYLEAALEARQYELLWIAVDPKYDPLRDDPRFAALTARIGLDARDLLPPKKS